ncbi:hypothetical protein F9K75_09640 [Brucella intermedia]|nr:hypothetical protein F9K75_09640 [Brucella intermedia]
MGLIVTAMDCFPAGFGVRPSLQRKPAGKTRILLWSVSALLRKKICRSPIFDFRVKPESPEPLYVFVVTHFPTQNRFPLLLEML